MVQKEEEQQSDSIRSHEQQADGIEVTFYTDPLCCWSWAMQPQWRQLEERFKGILTVTCKMAGLLPSWNNFTDSINSIRKPAHMGPEWMHAQKISGVNIDPGIWVSDPPASSFPACIAVKCAELQSKDAAEDYLQLLREAVMVHQRNIARTDVLLELASRVTEGRPYFDLSTFREDLLGQRGRDAFRVDWQEARYKGITRLPTLIFRSARGKPVLLSGFQSFEALEGVVLSLYPVA